MKDRIEEKKTEAEKIIKNCAGKRGFYASDSRYAGEYWTRDLAYSIDTILDLGYHSEAKSHLELIFKNQKENGEVPLLLVENKLLWMLRKLWRSICRGRISYTLKHFRNVEFFEESTKDSTPLAVVALYRYCDYQSDWSLIKKYENEIKLSLRYVNGLLEDGFLPGSDWRDTMEEFRDKKLLSNQVLLYKFYKVLGYKKICERVKDKIDRMFWNGEYYTDYLGSDGFDLLGNSLCILHEIAPKKRYESISKKFDELSTNYGYRNPSFSRIAPFTKKEIKRVKHGSYSIMCPFISCHVILAKNKIGEKEIARKELKKLAKLNGFNEWYDSDTGEGLGSPNQLWSAAMFLKAAKELEF